MIRKIKRERLVIALILLSTNLNGANLIPQNFISGEFKWMGRKISVEMQKLTRDTVRYYSRWILGESIDGASKPIEIEKEEGSGGFVLYVSDQNWDRVMCFYFEIGEFLGGDKVDTVCTRVGVLKNLKGPGGMCIEEGGVNFDEALHIVERKGGSIYLVAKLFSGMRIERRYLRNAGLKVPWDVCVDSYGFSWVTDWRNHRVVRGNAVGVKCDEVLSVYGKYGSGEGEFKYPTGIAYLMKGDVGYLYICDSGNSRVVRLRIFYENVTECEIEWAGAIKIPGKVDVEGGGVWLYDIEVDNDGVYVLDNRFGRIIGLNHELNKFNFVVGGEGVGVGKFISPQGFRLIGDDLVVVEEWGSNSGLQYYKIDKTPFPPDSPVNVRVESSDGEVKLSWERRGDVLVKSEFIFEVWRKGEGEEEFIKVGEVEGCEYIDKEGDLSRILCLSYT